MGKQSGVDSLEKEQISMKQTLRKHTHATTATVHARKNYIFHLNFLTIFLFLLKILIVGTR